MDTMEVIKSKKDKWIRLYKRALRQVRKADTDLDYSSAQSRKRRFADNLRVCQDAIYHVRRAADTARRQA